MAGRGKKMRSLIGTRDNRQVASRKRKQQVELDLPTEVLELILSRLNLRENIRASAVCKRWLAAAVSARRTNRPPWLIFFPKYGDLYEFYDPSRRITYRLELPELRGSTICSAKDGWLLLYKPRTTDIFFFCPYTRETIKLPKLQLEHQIVALSAVPTSPSCVLFTVKQVNISLVAISTCHPGASKWSTVNYHSHLPFFSNIWNRIVFCNAQFFCLSVTGALGVYNPDKSTWALLPLGPPKCMMSFSVLNCWQAKFMAEHDGDIFAVCTSASTNPFIYRLDLVHGEWVEMESLGGMTMFANPLSSSIMTDVCGKLRNIIRGSSYMIGSIKIRLEMFGLNRLKTAQFFIKGVLWCSWFCYDVDKQ